MLSIEQIKNLLNEPNMPDDEAKIIRDEFHMLAEIIFEKWQGERQKPKHDQPSDPESV